MSGQISHPEPQPILAFIRVIGFSDILLAAATGFDESYVSSANRGLAELTPEYVHACSRYLWMPGKFLFRWNEELHRELGADPWPWDGWRSPWLLDDDLDGPVL